MARARTVGTQTNGAVAASSVPEAESPIPATETDETRRTLAILILAGSLVDAEALYFAMPGTTVLGWTHLLRSLEPARRYVLDGDPEWTHTVIVTDYQPVPTPAGDCAEDALPPELRNPYREAEKQKLEMERNGA